MLNFQALLTGFMKQMQYEAKNIKTGRERWAILQIFRLFWIPQKSPYLNQTTHKVLAKFLTPQKSWNWKFLPPPPPHQKKKKKSFDHPCHLKSGEPCYNNNNNNNNIWAQLELTDALVRGHCIQTQASLVMAPRPAQAMQPITWVRHLKGKQRLLERKVGAILVNRPLH